MLDIAPETVGGTFDVVLFLGVLYHLRHPFLAIEKLRSVTNELLILETHVDLIGTRRPAMALLPGHGARGRLDQLVGTEPGSRRRDARAVRLQRRDAGAPTLVAARPSGASGARAARHGGTQPAQRRTLRQGRAVFHARVTDATPQAGSDALLERLRQSRSRSFAATAS